MTPDAVLTPEEIADELGVHRQTVAAWLRSGELKGSRHGRRWYVRRSWLDEFMRPTNVGPDAA